MTFIWLGLTCQFYLVIGRTRPHHIHGQVRDIIEKQGHKIEDPDSQYSEVEVSKWTSRNSHVVKIDLLYLEINIWRIQSIFKKDSIDSSRFGKEATTSYS